MLKRIYLSLIRKPNIDRDSAVKMSSKIQREK